MTITIDVCWLDRTGSFLVRHAEFVKNTILKIIGFGCIPLFVIGILRFLNVIDQPIEHYGLDYMMAQIQTGAFCVIGFIGTFVTSLYLYVYLEEQNEKHQWIRIKHCENKGSEN